MKLNDIEILSLIDLNYDELIEYFKHKYGQPNYPYFYSKNRLVLNKNNYRTNEFLEIHHISKDKISCLWKPEIARDYDWSHQMPENLVYVNLVERLLLIIKFHEEDELYTEYIENLVKKLDRIFYNYTFRTEYANLKSIFIKEKYSLNTYNQIKSLLHDYFLEENRLWIAQTFKIKIGKSYITNSENSHFKKPWFAKHFILLLAILTTLGFLFYVISDIDKYYKELRYYRNNPALNPEYLSKLNLGYLAQDSSGKIFVILITTIASLFTIVYAIVIGFKKNNKF